MRKISDSKAVLMMESSRAEQVHQYHIREAKEIFQESIFLLSVELPFLYARAS